MSFLSRRFLVLFVFAPAVWYVVAGLPRSSAENDARPDSTASLETLRGAYQEGNYRDAYDGFRRRLIEKETPTAEFRQELSLAVQCVVQLGRFNELDALLEDVLAVWSEEWTALWAVADHYLSLPHDGFLVAGEFERGPHRGGGVYSNVMERDRVRALQLMAQAIPLAREDDEKHAVARFYLSLADHVLGGRGAEGGWRLQYLTDLDELPDAEEGNSYWQPRVGAPVDESGEPVYHQPSESWSAAETDGQRWRWALEQARENSPELLNQVRWRLGDFCYQQFGVQTIQEYFRPLHGGEHDSGDTSGTYALHTLEENETIARLATGIKRFQLPDEFNHIKIFQQIAAEPRTGSATAALQTLAQVFENRRQYPKAADYWRQLIAGRGQQSWYRQRLDQIVGNWGQFEGLQTQAAESGATVEFRFRNATAATFTAREIRIERLLQDIKQHVRGDPQNLDWSVLNVEQLGWRLLREGQEKYIGRRVARWEEQLEPRPAHFDRRVTITTPLRRAGAYWLTAELADGNTSQVVVWVADTALVQQTLSGNMLYLVADATSGEPIARANIEFFGYRHLHNYERKTRTMQISNFAARSDENGMLIPDKDQLKDNHQYMVIARTDEGRLAFLGFNSVWTGNYHLPRYEQLKAFNITDRPVYRPGQKMNFKFWVRKADYAEETPPRAGQSFSVDVIDPKGDAVASWSLTSDAQGGIDGQWEVPADATLGQYHFRILGGHNGTFRVEEYKKPEYEVTIDAPSIPVMLGERISATIRANYYFGAPVTEATVKYKVLRSRHDQRWYPAAPWDWCYGPGYWWFAYDYWWYPGWQSWVGCVRPAPLWAPYSPQPPEVVLEQEVPIGSDGTVSVEFDTDLARALHGDSDHRYTITAEVRDQSRRTIVGQGEVLVARQPYRVYTWLDRGYYRRGSTIEARFQAQTLDGRAVEGAGEVTLYRVTYDENRQPIETPVQQWSLATDVDGRAQLKFNATRQGQYRISCVVHDSAGHSIEGGYLFTITGAGFDGAQFRYNALELIPDRADYQPGDRARLQINTDHAGATVWLFVRPVNGIYLPPRVLHLEGKSTIYQLPVSRRDMPNFFVEAVTVFDGQVHRQAKEIVVPPEKRVLNVEVTPLADELLPGQKTKVRLHVTDFQGENFVGSTVVSIYDKAVEYIAGGSNVADIKEFFWKWRRHHSPHDRNNLTRWEWNMTRPGQPGMQPLGVFGASVADALPASRDSATRNLRAQRGDAGKSMMLSEAEGKMNSDSAFPPGDAAAPSPPAGDGQSVPHAEPVVRQNFADTALWVAALQTDQEGFAEVEVEMPENLSTWKVKVWAVGEGTRVGEGSAEIITTKNLILRLQAPRFAVQKDEFVLSANVHNYLANTKPVRVQLDLITDHLESLDAQQVEITVPADGEQRVDWRVRVAREGVATIRMTALTDEESDAVQVQLPCHVHGMLKTESWAGTVRPDRDQATLAINVPAERRPEQSRLVLRYSPTLAAAMVDALPYLADYPYGCTEQTLNRFLPSVITQNILLEMNLSLDEIRGKRTNLNAQELGDAADRALQWQRSSRNPVFDPEELARMVRQGVQRLTEMQLSDGGWGWFSGWGEESYPHTTAVVVRGLKIAEQNDVPLVPGVLERGIAWLERYQQQQIDWLDNTAEKRSHKRYADNLDALVYLTLLENGVDNPSMRDFLDRDRTNLSVYGKALFGLALQSANDQPRLQKVLTNLEQYLVQDEENETAYLDVPEGSWWYWYGDEIETQAAYLKLLSLARPQSRVAPRLVKYLLNNRKHATYWKSTRDTALCVEAFADYLHATGETQPDMVVEVWVDGQRRKEVEITAENLFSFDAEFVLEGDALTDGRHAIEIRRHGTGPVYFNAYLTNFTLEDPIAEAGLEVRVQRRFYHLVPAEKTVKVAGTRGQALDQRVEKFQRVPLDNLSRVTSGELVEVELVVESKNDYEYLLFEDRKAAGFEAVAQQSGFTNTGLHAYTEYRDDRVSFFVRQLARGRHSLSYRLRAEVPGRFSALPAVVAAMYAPELKGNSNEMKLQVEDRTTE